jgi:glutamate N-acetyltransferase/amino-acid N-acetyltransferase
MTLHLPAGFEFAGIHCGIKKVAGKLDLTLVHCPQGATAAGVYTQNLVCAAPVILDRDRTPSSELRAVVVNSGNANACTGERGAQDARAMARLAAAAVGADERQVLVMSTGIIGVFLPMEKIAAGAAEAGKALTTGEEAFIAAAKGIMTTDKGHKVASRKVTIGKRTFSLAGMCKGAGMIGPNMATMLGLLMTDAPLRPEDAQSLLKHSADRSFNCISVEGHTSTNDTMLLIASGAAGGPPLSRQELEQFQTALTDTCIELAKQIPDDGEGASHLIELDVVGCRTHDEARQIAQAVCNSALVKTAIAGGDPNWGRIVSAAGYAGVPFDPAGVDLTVNGFLLYERGAPVPFNARAVSESIKANRLTNLVLKLREGEVAIQFWSSDLNVDYVRFNADYST